MTEGESVSLSQAGRQRWVSLYYLWVLLLGLARGGHLADRGLARGKGADLANEQGADAHQDAHISKDEVEDTDRHLYAQPQQGCVR